MMRQQHQCICSHLRRVNIRQYDYRHSVVCHRQLQDHVHRHMTCCQIPVQQIILFDPILHRNHLVYLQCCQCLTIVHSLLPLRFPLSFLLICDGDAPRVGQDNAIQEIQTK
jgi:hypothetical protein